MQNEHVEPLLDNFIGQLFKTRPVLPAEDIVLNQMEIQTDTYRANDDMLLRIEDQLQEVKNQVLDLKQLVDMFAVQF